MTSLISCFLELSKFWKILRQNIIFIRLSQILFDRRVIIILIAQCFKYDLCNNDCNHDLLSSYSNLNLP